MGETKHEKTYVDFDRGYEQNVVGVRGVVYFGIGLFLLIVITFGLMWLLLGVLEEQAAESDARNRNPLALTKEEALPPEPRLQSAPGFGVGPADDRINLELTEPQSEYRVLEEQWEELWENGQTVTGADGKKVYVTLPLADAKKRLLEEKSADSEANKDGEKLLEDSKKMISPSSSGRMFAGKRR